MTYLWWGLAVLTCGLAAAVAAAPWDPIHPWYRAEAQRWRFFWTAVLAGATVLLVMTGWWAR